MAKITQDARYIEISETSSTNERDLMPLLNPLDSLCEYKLEGLSLYIVRSLVGIDVLCDVVEENDQLFDKIDSRSAKDSATSRDGCHIG